MYCIQTKSSLFSIIFIVLITGSLSCNDNLIDLTNVKIEDELEHYKVELPLAQKAALKYFRIHQDAFQEWKSYTVSLKSPLLCKNLKGYSTAYIFNVIDGNEEKGMLIISAYRKWRPLISSGTSSIHSLFAELKNYHSIKDDCQIEPICVDGFSLIFKVKQDDSNGKYYVNTHQYPQIGINKITKIQNKMKSVDKKFTDESVTIWEGIENEKK